MAKFKDYNFPKFLEKALDEIGFIEPTEVQERLIPVIRQGKNVIGQSKTGSGKTHTFLLPIFEKIDPKLDAVQVVITVPSRELAEQIYQAAQQLAKFSDTPIRIANYVGGTDRKRQMEKLAHHQPHIVIGTSGRILDLTKGALKIFTAKIFVVDEADMALDLGFLPEVDQIASQLTDVQFLVFSATIPEKLQPFLKKYLENPVAEAIESRTIISDKIDNWLISTKGNDKNAVILKLLQSTNPYLAIVFANTKERVNEITKFLQSNGLKVAKLHGGIEPRERKRVMKQVRNLDYQFLVATDLAARGIDIEGISHVINDEIPADLDFFVH
ncbi:MAG: DEAD/DEAH box helicase, partial [Streptococcaceae bacterium]|nr:DEAD/DEAH box helicase [Streptococcaceae bacterium]